MAKENTNTPYRNRCGYLKNGELECGDCAECFMCCPGLMERAKELWGSFSNAPINPETECLEEAWHTFPTGTHRKEIWSWFEEQFNLRVASDLMHL